MIFCGSKNYKDFVKKLGLMYNSRSIVTICFTPNCDESVKNVNKREDKKPMKAFRIVSSIQKLKPCYDFSLKSDVYIYRKMVNTFTG